MNNKAIIRKELLRRKIQEFFNKNPKSKSVVVSLGEGDSKTAWKVQKEKGYYHITEVVAKTENFIIEQPPAVAQTYPAVQQPVAGQQTPMATNPTTTPQQQMGQMGAQQHNVAAYEQQDFSGKMSMLQGGLVPMNADNVAMAFAELLKPGAGRDVVALRSVIEQGASMAPPEARQALGSTLGFLTVLSNQRRLMQAHKNNSGKRLTEKQQKKKL